MLAKKYRLPIQEFTLKRAEITRGSNFSVKTFPSSRLYSRYGVIIAKKVAPLATERNRIKRLIFSYCRPLVGAPRDVLIIVQKGAIIEELRKLL